MENRNKKKKQYHMMKVHLLMAGCIELNFFYYLNEFSLNNNQTLDHNIDETGSLIGD